MEAEDTHYTTSKDTYLRTLLESYKASDTVMATRMKRRRRENRLAQRGPRRACALKG
jgi:hypothetical protein